MQLRDVPTQDIAIAALFNFRVDSERTEDFGALVDSIRRYGLLQPLIVRRIGPNSEKDSHEQNQRFQLVSGHRKYFACSKLGRVSIPCIIMELGDQEAFEVALIENVQRQSLNPIEEAEAFKSYVVNFGRGSISRLAQKIGKSEEYVSHRLLLLGLPKVLAERISRRRLNPSIAIELIWLKNENQQVDLSDEISKNGLSLREVRDITRMIKNENMQVHEAVQHVMQTGQRREVKIVSKKHDDQEDGGECDPWQGYSNNWGDRNQALDMLSRAILVVRTCLAGLDLLVDKSDGSPNLLNVLMNERNNVHTVLDGLIHTSTDYKRNRIRVSLTP